MLTVLLFDRIVDQGQTTLIQEHVLLDNFTVQFLLAEDESCAYRCDQL